MIKSRSNSSNANVMVNVSVIKASNVSTIYVARGKRAGIFEIVSDRARNPHNYVKFVVMQTYYSH
jgi:hypothetical protein